MQQSQDLCSHAEKAVSEMEKAAFDQLQEQAIQHEKAQKKIKIDVNNINKQTQEYQWLIKVILINYLFIIVSCMKHFFFSHFFHFDGILIESLNRIRCPTLVRLLRNFFVI